MGAWTLSATSFDAGTMYVGSFGNGTGSEGSSGCESPSTCTIGMGTGCVTSSTDTSLAAAAARDCSSYDGGVESSISWGKAVTPEGSKMKELIQLIENILKIICKNN